MVQATPVPKGATVGEVKDIQIGSALSPTKPAPVNIPQNVKWNEGVKVAEATQPGGKQAVATFIPDGDGVNMKLADGGSLSCRLHSIDAPEVAKEKDWKDGKGKLHKASPDQAYGPEARDYLTNLIKNKEVTVVVTQSAENSKQGRNFCQVSFEGKDVSLSMVEAGFAQVYDQYVRPELAKSLYSAQLKAKEEKNGLWQQLYPMKGESFRRMY